jgi:hypothetical protein
MALPRKIAALTAAAATTVAAGAAAGPALAHNPGSHDDQARKLAPAVREQLREVRRATMRFRDPAVARAAGYTPAADCVDDPKYGGMGIHYANAELIADDALDPLKPEILVYQPRHDGKRRLVAVEWFRPDADQDLATSEDRPTMFDLPFDGPMLGHEPGMPIHYDLHAWIYKHNPAGMFAMYNPRVTCPPDEGEAGGH